MSAGEIEFAVDEKIEEELQKMNLKMENIKEAYLEQEEAKQKAVKQLVRKSISSSLLRKIIAEGEKESSTKEIIELILDSFCAYCFEGELGKNYCEKVKMAK